MDNQGNEGQQPNPTLATPAHKEPEKQDADFNARMEQFQRREKSLRDRERRIQQQEAELNSRQPQENWTELLQKDFGGAMAKAGFTHEALAQKILEISPENMQARGLEARLQQIEEGVNQKLGKLEEHTKTSYERALNQYKRDTQNFVKANSEAYELISSTQSEDAVVELIKETFDKDGYLMSVEDACKQVEEYLLEEAVTFAKSKKVQAKLAPPPPVEPPQETKTQITQQIQPKTLTNAVNASTKPLTAKDRRERAIAAFMGNKQ